MNRIELKNDICYLTIDNPPNNYLQNPEFIKIHEIENLLKNKNCKGILISGVGRHFSAGADLSRISEIANTEQLQKELENGKSLINYLKNLNIPIISAIEGVCFGGGLEIILNSDIKIASEKALFAFPEVNQNLIPGLTGTYALQKHTQKAHALEIILGADTFNVEMAQKISVIDYVVKPKTTLQTATNLLQKMTANRPVSIINSVVKLVRNREGLSYDELIQEETRLFCEAAKKINKK